MNKRKRILIVEDQALVRALLRELLSSDPGLEPVGECENGREAMRLVGKLEPDLALIDLFMPGTNGVEAIVDIKSRFPDTKIVVLTMYDSPQYIEASLRAGADGYLLKDATPEELLSAIRIVLDGKRYLSSAIAGHVVSRFRARDGAENPGPWETLTHREREVLQLIAQGRSNKEIADFLCLSLETVKTHRSRLLRKAKAHNASALTSYAIGAGMVASSPSLR